MKMCEHGKWVGIDWGDGSHAVRMVDHQGQLHARFEVPHSPEGLEALVQRLAAHGPVAGVAIETSRHLVVDVLVRAGFVVYPINPKVSHAWRQAWSVSGAKDDGRDALVLADGLRCRHSRLQPYVAQDAATRELALLCEDEKALTQRRTALVQQLRAALKQYHPGALEWFSQWTSPTAWDFIIQFPTAPDLAKATKQRLVGFLKSHRIGLRAVWQERIERRKQAQTWPCEEATVRAKSLLAVSQAKQLRTIQATLKTYRKRIKALFDAHPDSALFASLPGAGAKLQPRLLSAVGMRREAYDSAAGLQRLSGTAPVTEQSGRSRRVHIRRACRKTFRHYLHLFAFQTLQHSPWSRAYYDLARARGQSHALALRNLANKWLKIIYRMWQNREVYDPQRYGNQLVKTRSPVAQALGLLKTTG